MLENYLSDILVLAVIVHGVLECSQNSFLDVHDPWLLASSGADVFNSTILEGESERV